MTSTIPKIQNEKYDFHRKYFEIIMYYEIIVLFKVFLPFSIRIQWTLLKMIMAYVIIWLM